VSNKQIPILRLLYKNDLFNMNTCKRAFALSAVLLSGLSLSAQNSFIARKPAMI
jgi:hypothetical protein